jgi:hypothetical protein
MTVVYHSTMVPPMAVQNYNRRLGERLDVEPVDAALVVYRRPTTGWFRRLRSGVVELPVRIVNISMSGARVEASEQQTVASGSIVLLRLNGTESEARIAGPRQDRNGRWAYGLEFGQLHEDFEKEVHATIGALPFVRDGWFVPQQTVVEETWGQWLN